LFIIPAVTKPMTSRSRGVKDEARRRIERELDLRDAHLTSVRAED
jgi:hypothetical protein